MNREKAEKPANIMWASQHIDRPNNCKSKPYKWIKIQFSNGERLKIFLFRGEGTAIAYSRKQIQLTNIEVYMRPYYE